MTTMEIKRSRGSVRVSRAIGLRRGATGLLVTSCLFALVIGCEPGSGFGDDDASGFDQHNPGLGDTTATDGTTTTDGTGDVADTMSTSDFGGADGTDSPNAADAPSSDGESVDWPPLIEPASDSGGIDSSGGTLTLLGGEVSLTFPDGAIADPTTITVDRKLVSASSVELVGYIWGPHGRPIEPSATLSITVDTRWIPPTATDDTVGLLLIDGETVTALESQTVTFLDGGTRVTLTAQLDTLATIAIGPIPSP
jgi:hypothetical protein